MENIMPTPEQIAVMRWWLFQAPDTTTKAEALKRFKDVGMTPRLAQLALYNVFNDSD